MKNTHYIEREQDIAFRNNLPQSKEGNPTKKEPDNNSYKLINGG